MSSKMIPLPPTWHVLYMYYGDPLTSMVAEYPKHRSPLHHPFSAEGLESRSILVFPATSWLAWSNRLAATWASADWCELRSTKEAEKFESCWILLTFWISFPKFFWSWKSLRTPVTLVRWKTFGTQEVPASCIGAKAKSRSLALVITSVWDAW